MCDQFAEKCDVHFISDICLVEPYLEFDSVSTDDDPFNGINFTESFNEILPSPSKFRRSESMTPMERSCHRGIIISILNPYTIIAVAPDILSIAEFTSGQICGRSINVLFGPRTDIASLSTAIKNAGHGQSSTIDNIFYSSTGVGLHVTATCSPYCRPSDRSLSGCLLQIDCIHIPDTASSEPERPPEPVLLLDVLCLLQPSPKCPLLRRLRREANLAAGRDNEAERRRQQRGRLPPDAAPARA
jgi:hypothetical protein